MHSEAFLWYLIGRRKTKGQAIIRQYIERPQLVRSSRLTLLVALLLLTLLSALIALVAFVAAVLGRTH